MICEESVYLSQLISCRQARATDIEEKRLSTNSKLDRVYVSCFLIICLTLISNAAVAGHEIQLWHSMNNESGEKFEEIINRFNQRKEIQKKDVKIVPSYKGSNEELFSKALKMIGNKNAPHIMQLYEKGRIMMQSYPLSYVPLEKLTKKPSPRLKAEHFISHLRPYFKGLKDQKGLQSLPFSASTAILIYNKNAFSAAGLNPNLPPVTWEHFESLAKKLKNQNLKSVLASSWLSGHQVDQLGAIHNEPMAAKSNDPKNSSFQLTMNRPFFIHHLEKLATWYQNGWFSLEVGAKAEEDFVKGEIAILTLGVNRLKRLEKLINKQFEIGVGNLPYWSEHQYAPQASLAGISSLWALAGHSEEDYAIIQQFFEYLTSASVQAEWHQTTGYLPVIKEAKTIIDDQKNHNNALESFAAKVALESFLGQERKHPAQTSENLQGVLVFHTPKMREIMSQEIKEAIRGHKTAKEALDRVVFLGNRILKGEN